MKKKVLSWSTAALLGVSFIGFSFQQGTAEAESLEERMDTVKEKRSDVSKSLSESKKEIESLEAEQKKIDEEIKQLDEAVTKTSEKIRNKNDEIDKTRQQIENLKKDIKKLDKRIKKRNEILKERARAMQTSGGSVDYIEVLLGSQDFSDLLNRVNAVSTISSADRDILEAHEEDKRVKKEKEDKVKEDLSSLETSLKELETLKADQEKQAAEKDAFMAKLKESQQTAEDKSSKLENEDELLSEQEKAIQEQMKKQKEEAEKQVSSAQPVKSTSTSGGDTSTSGGETPPVASGTFTRPAAGPVTSEFGIRSLGDHKGIDIGKRGASVPIVAAADGQVFRSYYSSTYGNAIFITHNVNGKVYTTVYAHMESRNVSGNETVKKGQVIGYMGNTGRSYGAHLHFEMHEGPWNLEKTNAVDPRKYINF
ncbi:murein hydrolase activator EnvC family protein [Priestia filamentosa]|uniref:murein hydrolase activator EnvC family protein n=1 Tax=Priestia filamentosa TaxID=1402861 RepID=UPI0005890AE7|nr:peptidoglycan DD-metalloendopeptidase family protein [Priestia filamentosa]MDT3765009.1 peptidoglycan DD-metalloendopeptidase family protein [Priestia filamentosa]OXS66722.1 peptidase M23 [Priestia filamentosa]RJS66192.1 peptidase M23 [Priestia filamentosa]WCM15598.1 peptidoglycan DD-metalloendopeptidase family protein [Priestia filamentosa]WRU95320.1 peptidoglycan DD-metalloendopeptidase family protein [Priestia filamentosa]